MSFKIGAENILNKNNGTQPSPLANQLSNSYFSFGNQEDSSLDLKISDYADKRFQASTFTTFGKTNRVAKISRSPSTCSNRTPVYIAPPVPPYTAPPCTVNTVPPAPPPEGINSKQPFRKNPSSQEKKPTSSNSPQSGIDLNAIRSAKAGLKNTKTEDCTNAIESIPPAEGINSKQSFRKNFPPQEKKSTSLNSLQSSIDLNAIRSAKAGLKNTKTEGCTNSTAPTSAANDISSNPQEKKSTSLNSPQSSIDLKAIFSEKAGLNEIDLKLQKELQELDALLNELDF